MTATAERQLQREWLSYNGSLDGERSRTHNVMEAGAVSRDPGSENRQGRSDKPSQPRRIHGTTDLREC